MTRWPFCAAMCKGVTPSFLASMTSALFSRSKEAISVVQVRYVAEQRAAGDKPSCPFCAAT